MFLLFLVLVVASNPEFFEMVDTQTKQGYTWEYVGRTEVTDEVALPAVEENGTKVYYWYLTSPNNE